MVKFNDKIIDTAPLSFAGASTFQGQTIVSAKGNYEIIVYAFDSQTGNTGVGKVKVSVN
jgi:hypothetical protein